MLFTAADVTGALPVARVSMPLAMLRVAPVVLAARGGFPARRVRVAAGVVGVVVLGRGIG